MGMVRRVIPSDNQFITVIEPVISVFFQSALAVLFIDTQVAAIGQNDF